MCRSWHGSRQFKESLRPRFRESSDCHHRAIERAKKIEACARDRAYLRLPRVQDIIFGIAGITSGCRYIQLCQVQPRVNKCRVVCQKSCFSLTLVDPLCLCVIVIK